MLALTERQREEMRDNGFTVMPSFFQGPELAAILAGVEASIAAKQRGEEGRLAAAHRPADAHLKTTCRCTRGDH